MGIFGMLGDWWAGFGSGDRLEPVTPVSGELSSFETTEINPASGLPMIGGIGGVDIGGNLYGTDHHTDDFCSITGGGDDSWLSTETSSWDDSSWSDS